MIIKTQYDSTFYAEESKALKIAALTMKLRLHKLDSLKFLAMVCVLAAHIMMMTPGRVILRPYCVIVVLGPAMFLFSVISGWCIKPGRQNFARNLRFLGVVVAFNLLLNIIDHYVGGNTRRSLLSVANTYWYFYVLLACRFVLPFFKRPLMALFVACLFSWLSFLYPVGMCVNPIGRFVGFVPFVALGYFIGNDLSAVRIKQYLLNDDHWRIYLLISFFVVVVSLCLVVLGVSSEVDRSIRNVNFMNCSIYESWRRVLSHVVCMFWCLLWFKSIPRRELPFSKLGRRTIGVYFLHMIPLFVGYGLMGRFEILKSPGFVFLIVGIESGIIALMFHTKVHSYFNMVLGLKPRGYGVG